MNNIHKSFAVSAAILMGATSAFAEYTLNVVFPSFPEWMFATPMISLDGGKTGKAMSVIPDKCGWFKYSFESISDISDKVVFYRSNDPDRDDMIGLDGNWESGAEATPIPLATIFEGTGKNELFFVSDEELLLVSTDDGWYDSYPDVEGVCQYSLPQVSYPATAQNIKDLKECGTACFTDTTKFAAILGEKVSGSCEDNSFDRTATNTWAFSKESHSNTCTRTSSYFTMESGSKLSISGASIAWAFIDGKPVALKSENNSETLDLDSQEAKYTPGMIYRLDVFYCDQEGNTPFINIASNLDMSSVFTRSAITAKATKNKTNKALTSYEICYTYSPANTCGINGYSEAVVEICGTEFSTKPEAKDLKITYYLSSGTALSMDKAIELDSAKVYYGGIDLTDYTTPKINKSKLVMDAGRWTLFVKIGDSLKKLASFSVAAEVSVMSESSIATFLSEEGYETAQTPYKFVGEGVVGTLIPLYISAFSKYDGSSMMYPDDAAGISYKIESDQPSVMILAAAKDSTYNVISSEVSRTIGTSGVDTLYAYIDSATFAKEHQGQTSLDVKINVIGAIGDAATIRFKQGEIDKKPNIVLAIKELQARAVQSSYAIYDLKGKVVKRGIATPGSTIPAPGQGTYIIRTNGKSKVVKFK